MAPSSSLVLRGFALRCASSFTAVLAGSILVAACSSGGSGSSGGASTLSGFAAQFCSLYAPCCADAGLSTSGQQCTSLVESTPGFNPSVAQACIDALEQASTQPGFCATGGTNSSACSGVFPGAGGGGSGTTKPGQTCTQDSDCLPESGGGATCMFTTGSDGGSAHVCVQTLPGKAGDGPCIGTKSSTGTTLSWGAGALPSMAYVCDGTQALTCDFSTQKCVALAPTGQPCTGDSACVASDYCDYGGTGAPSCAPRLADGASCATASSACKTTSYCDTTTQKCTAGLPDGAACTSGSPCQSHACVNGKCGSGGLALGLFCGP